MENYISALGAVVDKYTVLESRLDDKYFNNMTFEELREENRKMYEDVIAYGNSYANPSHTSKLFGEEAGKILSALYSQFRVMISYAFEHNKDFIGKYADLYKSLLPLLREEQLNIEKINKIYLDFFLNNTEDFVGRIYMNNFTRNSDTNKLLETMDLSDERYIFRYGAYISDNEIKLAEFTKNYPKDKLKDLAKTIVEAYVRGFEQDNKDISLRTYVRIVYNIGQELLIREIMNYFEENNLKGIAVVADSTEANKQYSFDHKFDNALYLTREFLDREKDAMENISAELKNELKDFSGSLYIEKFGEEPFSPKSKVEVLKLDSAQTDLSMEENIVKRNFREKHMPDKETSFCIVAFPSPEIGDKFEEIYEDICEINKLDSAVHEPIQKVIIDNLDKGEYVEVKGRGSNRTDIRVKMPKLNNPDKETNFFNCTADVNIPLGEIFTSPSLEGTNGILHLERVYLEELEYLNLELHFEEGYIKYYNCSNFEKVEDNKRYIEENLLFPHKTLPLGEFAIGTNTLAYVISKKYDIVDKLPILIVEKMGPHFAIGDTCYSWSEDLPVYNKDGKEIVARDNSHSIKRKEDVSKAYTNVHTDITIPYDDIEVIKVITYDKKEIEIIKNGRFVLVGTEFLNEVFE
jgi:leucyl aminopeptidase (aminopeptidase T)